MDRLTIRIIASFLLIVDLMMFVFHVTFFDSFTLLRGCSIGLGIVLGWIIWRNREPLPLPHLQISLNHTNLTNGTTIFSVCSSRNGYVHVVFDGLMKGHRAVIPCEVFYVLANKTEDFDINFPAGTTGKIVAALFPRKAFDRDSGEQPLFEVEAPLE